MEESQKTTEENYIEYVVEKIRYLQKVTGELERVNPELFQVKDILSRRTHIGLSLVSEKERARTELKKLKRRNKIWWSEKFTEVRHELNPRDLAGTKYASKSDIEAETIRKHKEEFNRQQEMIDEVESRFEFLRGLLEQWNNLQYDLANLVKTMEIELNLMGNFKKPQVRERPSNG